MTSYEDKLSLLEQTKRKPDADLLRQYFKEAKSKIQEENVKKKIDENIRQAQEHLVGMNVIVTPFVVKKQKYGTRFCCVEPLFELKDSTGNNPPNFDVLLYSEIQKVATFIEYKGSISDINKEIRHLEEAIAAVQQNKEYVSKEIVKEDVFIFEYVLAIENSSEFDKQREALESGSLRQKIILWKICRTKKPHICLIKGTNLGLHNNPLMNQLVPGFDGNLTSPIQYHPSMHLAIIIKSVYSHLKEEFKRSKTEFGEDADNAFTLEHIKKFIRYTTNDNISDKIILRLAEIVLKQGLRHGVFEKISEDNFRVVLFRTQNIYDYLVKKYVEDYCDIKAQEEALIRFEEYERKQPPLAQYF